MDRLVEDCAAKLWLDSIFKDEVDPASEQRFQKRAQIHVAIERFLFEFNDEIQITGLGAFFPSPRSKEPKPSNAIVLDR